MIWAFHPVLKQVTSRGGIWFRGTGTVTIGDKSATLFMGDVKVAGFCHNADFRLFAELAAFAYKAHSKYSTLGAR